MSQSLTQVYLHFVFSTEGRRPFLCNKQLRDQLFAYMAGVCKKMKAPSLRIGGVEDHAHMLCRMSRTLAIATLVQELKRDSSKWIKLHPDSAEDFHWQKGYGAFSVSPTHVPALIEYIKNQDQHHRGESYQDEFRRICARYGIEIDERYVWD